MKHFKAMLATLLLVVTSPILAANVNTADAETLAVELVGVGEKTAQAIVEERKANGPFKNAEDLDLRVKGVGPKTIEKNAGKLQF